MMNSAGSSSSICPEYVTTISSIAGPQLMVECVFQPQISMAMARDGLLPPFFSDDHKKSQVPVKGTITTVIVYALLTFFMNVSQLAGMWTDCHLAGALGLLRILIYEAYANGKTTMSLYERKASLREFHGIIFPSLMQIQSGITEIEDWKQKEVCATKYKRKDGMIKGKLTEMDQERVEECGICMEITTKLVSCLHT